MKTRNEYGVMKCEQARNVYQCVHECQRGRQKYIKNILETRREECVRAESSLVTRTNTWKNGDTTFMERT